MYHYAIEEITVYTKTKFNHDPSEGNLDEGGRIVDVLYSRQVSSTMWQLTVLVEYSAELEALK